MIKSTMLNVKKILSRKLIYTFANNLLESTNSVQTVGCRNELGRLPLQHIINTAIVRYLYDLKELPDNYIAKQTLEHLRNCLFCNSTDIENDIAFLIFLQFI